MKRRKTKLHADEQVDAMIDVCRRLDGDALRTELDRLAATGRR